MEFKYETHCHTYPVSKCAISDVKKNLEYYKRWDYDGVFITNHFIDGNINIDKKLPYKDKIDFYLTDYYKAVDLSKQLDIKVFFGVELSHKGTDFLIYGLSDQWYLTHSEINEFTIQQKLILMRQEGAFIIQAHPYREASYIDHIRLFPKYIDAVEVVNSTRNDKENKLAESYAESYALLKTAGSDNHGNYNFSEIHQKKLNGIKFDYEIKNVGEFIDGIKSGKAKLFEEYHEQ